MKAAFSAAGAGALFGVGLGLSGMTQPARIIGFLDVFGHWDPSLMFVMMGALLTHFVLSRVVQRLDKPLFDLRWHLPASRPVDRPLVVGAATFGVGWGLGGFCPGPALVALGSGALPALIFVCAMAVGMVLYHAAHRARGRGYRLRKSSGSIV
jgi:uncharacterized membrane protein YedE/YeeE